MKTYYANIKDGKLVTSLLERISKDCTQEGGRCIEITVNLQNYKRSIENNPHYRKWIAILAKELDYTKEQMNDIVKQKFLKQPTLIGPFDEEFFIYNTDLSIKEGKKFMDELKEWAKTHGVELPDYGESIFDFKPI